MMRQSSNSGRRLRGRPNRNKPHGGPPNRNSTFESNGPEGKVRGNAAQVFEKYVTLARETASAGNRVGAEAFYQHAEHYYRIINDSTDPRSDSSSGQGGFVARDGQGPPRRNGTDDEEPRHAPASGEGVVAAGPAMSEPAAAGTLPPRVETPAAAAPEGAARRARAPQEPAPEFKTAQPAAASLERNQPADSETKTTPQKTQAPAAERIAAGGAAVDDQPSERPRRGRPRKATSEVKPEGERPRRGRPPKAKPAKAEEPAAVAEKSGKASDTAA